VIAYDKRLFYEESLVRKLEREVRRYKTESERQAWAVVCLLFVLALASWWQQLMRT